jgi:acetyl-CoA carboxylase biotin carboxyl carrier protein
MAGERTIKAPFPGIFYRRSDPDAEPYVSEGDPVAPGDVVGLVEVMKTFHEVKAEEQGVVERFLVDNEGEVDAGQDLVALGD